jgi:hypothetical protein
MRWFVNAVEEVAVDVRLAQKRLLARRARCFPACVGEQAQLFDGSAVVHGHIVL